MGAIRAFAVSVVICFPEIDGPNVYATIKLTRKKPDELSKLWSIGPGGIDDVS